MVESRRAREKLLLAHMRVECKKERKGEREREQVKAKGKEGESETVEENEK